jgi:hypothetical protein
MDLQQGVSMDAPALVGLLFMFSLGNKPNFYFCIVDVVLTRVFVWSKIGYRVFLFLKSRCSSGSASTTKQQEIQYRCSTPDAKSFVSVSDKSIEDLLNGCTLINDTFDGDRTPLPSPSFDKLLTHQKHKSVRSILQDTMQDDASFASSVHRRSPRRAPSSNSFRDLSPTRSVVSNVSLSQSRR